MEPKIKKPSKEEIKEAKEWPIWEKEVSEFPWYYDEIETCFLLEGQVTVTNEDGEVFQISEGDYVIFPSGMRCTWKIHKSVRKHYKFG
jgi:uncharacterized cupin superfamily protein